MWSINVILRVLKAVDVVVVFIVVVVVVVFVVVFVDVVIVHIVIVAVVEPLSKTYPCFNLDSFFMDSVPIKLL